MIMRHLCDLGKTEFTKEVIENKATESSRPTKPLAALPNSAPARIPVL